MFFILILDEAEKDLKEAGQIKQTCRTWFRLVPSPTAWVIPETQVSRDPVRLPSDSWAFATSLRSS